MAPARTIAASAAAALATLVASAASPPQPRQPDSPPRVRQPDSPRPANDGAASPFSFLESLFGVPPPPRRPPAYRSGPRRESSPPGRGRQGRTPPPAPAAAREEPGASDSVATYRTLCVRLCDGYYWPISFATDKAHLSRDSRTCTRSCSAPAALYYHPNPGGAPEDMVSLDGVPYKSLGTAFLFRASYDASCKCRPHPWEKEALERSQPSAQGKERRTATRRSKR